MPNLHDWNFSLKTHVLKIKFWHISMISRLVFSVSQVLTGAMRFVDLQICTIDVIWRIPRKYISWKNVLVSWTYFLDQQSPKYSYKGLVLWHVFQKSGSLINEVKEICMLYDLLCYRWSWVTMIRHGFLTLWWWKSDRHSVKTVLQNLDFDLFLG